MRHDEGKSVRTKDKAVALAFLEPYLESESEIDARIQNLDGLYVVEISRPTDSGDKDEPIADS